MTQRDVSITTADGVLDAGLHTPDGEGPWPAVIMYPDAFGRREVLEAMGQRLADFGYAVLVPNFYYRAGEFEPFEPQTAFGDPAERERLFGFMQSLTPDALTADTEAMIAFLAEQPEVASGKVGTTGYCMGGRISLTMAGRLGDRIGAAASFHGGRLAVDDDPNSPHQLAGHVRAKLLIAGAENDQSFDDEQFERLELALTAAGVDFTLVTYPALHGFVVPDQNAYDVDAAERHWRELPQLLAGALG